MFGLVSGWTIKLETASPKATFGRDIKSLNCVLILSDLGLILFKVIRDAESTPLSTVKKFSDDTICHPKFTSICLDRKY